MFRHPLALALLCWAVSATPVRTIDGDTFVARLAIWPGLAATETIRVLGVDAPEMQGATRAAGQEARAFTEAWLRQSETVRVHACTRDAFGRLLGTVTRDAENLAEKLIEAKLARPYRPGGAPR